MLGRQSRPNFESVTGAATATVRKAVKPTRMELREGILRIMVGEVEMVKVKRLSKRRKRWGDVV